MSDEGRQGESHCKDVCETTQVTHIRNLHNMQYSPGTTCHFIGSADNSRTRNPDMLHSCAKHGSIRRARQLFPRQATHGENNSRIRGLALQPESVDS
ncbi:MAG: hypothetical protein KDH19_07640 [Geminicoccaceae bacterium]|nr:hypothetical protein [Geminicoccaceae bacterium]MCB2011540.1 hypothetical protein [Geminicoccaceae bacterium]